MVILNWILYFLLCLLAMLLFIVIIGKFKDLGLCQYDIHKYKRIGDEKVAQKIGISNDLVNIERCKYCGEIRAECIGQLMSLDPRMKSYSKFKNWYDYEIYIRRARR